MGANPTPCAEPRSIEPEQRCAMGKGNNAQGKEKKKPKKDAKAPKPAPPPRKK